jgi:hypothetical protein
MTFLVNINIDNGYAAWPMYEPKEWSFEHDPGICSRCGVSSTTMTSRTTDLRTMAGDDVVK